MTILKVIFKVVVTLASQIKKKTFLWVGKNSIGKIFLGWIGVGMNNEFDFFMGWSSSSLKECIKDKSPQQELEEGPRSKSWNLDTKFMF